MTAEEFIAALPAERKEIFKKIRGIIVETDKSVNESVDHMMGSQMLIYKSKENNIFKYALANQKEYISLHNIILYGHHKLREKYEALMPKVKFQKACLNFKNMETVPLDLVKSLLEETAKCDFQSMMAKK